MAKVFISHSWKDNDISRKIARNLKLDGADIWIDYATIKSGAIPARISQALEWCDTMVLIWSKAAAKSYYVGLEWQSALDLQKSIIPCIIDETKRPAILRGFLFIDFRDFDRGYARLFQALELKREKPAEQPSKPVEKVEKKKEQEKPKEREIKTIEELVHHDRIQEKEKQVESSKQPIHIKKQSKTQKKVKIESPEKSVRTEKVHEKQKKLKILSLFIAVFIIGFIGIYIANKMNSRSDLQYQNGDKVPQQKLTKDSLKTKTVKDMKLIFIPGGTFEMGNTFDDGDDDEKPVHSVTVFDFYMSMTEVTNAQFCQFLNEKGNQTDGGVTWLEFDSEYCLITKQGGKFVPKSGYENHSVIEVSWYGAKAFSNWAGCRLPTEAEWEYAARNGWKKVKYPHGNNLTHNDANFSGTKGKDKWNGISQVASFPPNELGLYDMVGNVWEWCADWYDKNYYQTSPSNNPKGPTTGQHRVLRGGSWGSNEHDMRCSHRADANPNSSYRDIGFRLVR